MQVDDEVIADHKTSCAIFNYSFKLDGYFFNLVQIDDGKFDLKINSFFFKDLIEAEEQGELKHQNKHNNINNNNYKEENLDDDDDNDDEQYNNNNHYNDENNDDEDDFNPDKQGLID